MEIDSENCINSNYKNCEDVVIKTPGHICCQINEETSITQRQTCEIKTTKEEQNKLVGSSFIINKELGGVQKIMKNTVELLVILQKEKKNCEEI